MFRHAHILTASGVGGGSLIYSNVNLQAGGGARPHRDEGHRLQPHPEIHGKVSRQVQQGGHQDPLPAGRDPGAAQQKSSNPAQASKDYLLLDRSRALRDASDLVAKQIGVAMPWTSARPVGQRNTWTETMRQPIRPVGPTRYTPSASARDAACSVACQRRGTRLNKTLVKFVFSKNPQVTLSPRIRGAHDQRVGDAYEVTYIDRRGENNSEGQTKTVARRRSSWPAGVLGTTEILLRSRNAGSRAQR